MQHYSDNTARDHPFNLKGGIMVFWGEIISLRKFDGRNYSVSDMDRKNILKAIYALKNCFCRKK